MSKWVIFIITILKTFQVDKNLTLEYPQLNIFHID